MIEGAKVVDHHVRAFKPTPVTHISNPPRYFLIYVNRRLVSFYSITSIPYHHTFCYRAVLPDKSASMSLPILIV
jgi:hypothetical protein